MKLTDIELRRAPHLNPGDTLEEAGRIMRTVSCHILPVTDKGYPVGTLSERELWPRDDGLTASPAVSVADVCRRDALVCSKSVHLKTALQLMRQHHQSWLLVTERDGTLAGMVTPLELLDLLIERVPEEAVGPEMESVHRVRGDYGTAL